MITVQQFRNNFPAFVSTADYPNDMISFWMEVAYQLLNASIWQNMLDTGAQLFTAHYCVIEFQNNSQAKTGNFPGLNVGVVTSESGDKLSVSFDVNSALEKDGGHWNQTNYGTRFYRLMKMFGSTPIQANVGINPNGGVSSANAWVGPIRVYNN